MWPGCRLGCKNLVRWPVWSLMSKMNVKLKLFLFNTETDSDYRNVIKFVLHDIDLLWIACYRWLFPLCNPSWDRMPDDLPVDLFLYRRNFFLIHWTLSLTNLQSLSSLLPPPLLPVTLREEEQAGLRSWIYPVWPSVSILMFNIDRKSTRLNSSHPSRYRMPSSAWKKKKK